MKQKQKRTVHFSFKVTPEESKVIQQKIKAFGLKNQSTFLRAMALKGYLRGSIYETEMDEIADRQDELRELMRQILQRLDEIQM